MYLGFSKDLLFIDSLSLTCLKLQAETEEHYLSRDNSEPQSLRKSTFPEIRNW